MARRNAFEATYWILLSLAFDAMMPALECDDVI